MNGYQAILLSVLVLSVLVFLIQWVRQSRHIFHGGRRHLTLDNIFVNWGVLIIAILAGIGLSTSGFHAQAEAEPHQTTVKSSSSSSSSAPKKTSSSTSHQDVRKAEQVSADQSAPISRTVKLNNNQAAVNFNVPAQTQFQIVDAGSGNVLHTFVPQSAATTVSYTFTKAGNYYLLVTKGDKSKTVTLTVN
ncbi:hypothetical protein [Limosilactobacillus kribbianus]|uniref:hypothetical protein n=1 Tax=Limosilactobacillus kribbianus TaxID=2982695 RepID=UPI0022640B10|nr:hypothetical protein [Limosilactobacillus kribbianus]